MQNRPSTYLYKFKDSSNYYFSRLSIRTGNASNGANGSAGDAGFAGGAGINGHDGDNDGNDKCDDGGNSW